MERLLTFVLARAGPSKMMTPSAGKRVRINDIGMMNLGESPLMQSRTKLMKRPLTESGEIRFDGGSSKVYHDLAWRRS